MGESTADGIQYGRVYSRWSIVWASLQQMECSMGESIADGV
jgi:hypothetical protein